VTGGAGFIGSHLVEALVRRNCLVRALDNFETGKRENLRNVQDRIEIVEGSILDQTVVDNAAQGIDWVFHLAAMPSVQRSIEDPITTHAICATGTLRVLWAALRADVKRVVYAASSSAYGCQEGVKRKEDDRVFPLSPYAISKLTGEHFCQCFSAVYGLETVCLRFFNIFGPRQDARNPYSGVIPLFLSAMLSGQAPTIFGDGLQSRDFTYVANAVEATILAAETPRAVGKVYNVGMGGEITIFDLVKQINLLLGSQLKPIHASPRKGDVRHSQADISRACSDLGYDPIVPFNEGLRRTLSAMQEVRPD
jgi:UDP-glucose 4-epimerase